MDAILCLGFSLMPAPLFGALPCTLGAIHARLMQPLTSGSVSHALPRCVAPRRQASYSLRSSSTEALARTQSCSSSHLCRAEGC